MPVPGSATYLYDLADDLLDACVLGLAQARTGHAPPDRSYVAWGPPAVDGCDDAGLVTVYVESVDHVLLDKAAGGGACHVRATATLVVEVWRCVPTLTDQGRPPADGDLDASAADLLADAWSLLTYLYGQWASGGLSAEPCQPEFGTVFPLGPSGGAGGFRLSATYDLNDAGP